MESTKFILLFYKEQQYIFGVCPCCQKIFQLTDCSIYFQGKRFVIKELDNVIEREKLVKKKEEKLDSLEAKLYDMQNQIETIQSEYENKVKPIIEKKHKPEGRKQALARIKKVDKVFTKKNINPRDIRLIFDPVEFVAFKGITDGEDVSAISFVSKSPQNKRQEKIIKSLSKSVKNGEYEFTLIRINENGSVDYSN